MRKQDNQKNKKIFQICDKKYLTKKGNNKNEKQLSNIKKVIQKKLLNDLSQI